MESNKNFIFLELINAMNDQSLDIEEVFSNKPLTELGLDSVGFVQLIVNIEIALGIEFDPYLLANIRTGLDLLELVNSESSMGA